MLGFQRPCVTTDSSFYTRFNVRKQQLNINININININTNININININIHI